MIVNEKEALARLNSPANLMNRLREQSSNPRSKAMSLFGVGGTNGLIKASTTASSAVPSVPTPNSSEVKSEGKQEDNPDDTNTNNDSPKLETLIDNAEAQIQLANSHNKAAKLLETAVGMLTDKIDGIDPDKLPSVINAASKVVNDIRRERNEAAKNGNQQRVNIIFYTPEQRKLSDYAIIDV